VTFTTLGLRASTGFSLWGADSQVNGALGWRHGFGDVTPVSILAFQGGNSFNTAGVPIAKDALMVDAGLEVTVAKATTVSLSYGGQFANAVVEQSFTGNLIVKF
jgi:fibronectin-binding autotransporter adhesin